MDLLALVPFFLLGLGLFWAIWLIFKRNLLDQNLGKLIAYFVGVVITLAVIGWIVDTYIPQWAARRLMNARESEDVQTIENVGRDIWEEAMSGETTPPTIVVSTPIPSQPTPVTTSPGQTPIPAETPAVSGQSAPGQTQSYTVASGDTLYSIARRFGVSVAAIQQYNNMGTSTAIQVGQTLNIPVP